MDGSTTTLAVLAGTLVVLAWGRFPAAAVAVAASLVLFAAGLVTVPQLLAGFGAPAVVLLLALALVSEGVLASGLMGGAAHWLGTRPTSGPRRTLALAMVVTAMGAALVGGPVAVGALLPALLALAARSGLALPRLLAAAGVAASAGSLLLLSGAAGNVVLSEAARGQGEEPFGFAELSLVGVPLVAVTVLVAVLMIDGASGGPAPWTVIAGPVGGAHIGERAVAAVAARTVGGDRFRMRLRAASPLVGFRPDRVRLPGDLRVVEAHGPDGTPVPAREALWPDDVITVRGSADPACRLLVEDRLVLLPVPRQSPGDPGAAATPPGGANPDGPLLAAFTAVVPPRSPLVGERARPGTALPADRVVLSLRRGGRDHAGETVLAPGDVLLVLGPTDTPDSPDADLLAVDATELPPRPSAPTGARRLRAVGVLLATAGLLSWPEVPGVVSGLLGALAMVLLGVVTPPRAQRTAPWSTAVLVAGLIPLAVALEESGAARRLADLIVGVAAEPGPYALLAVVFVVAASLGQVVAAPAVVVVMIPVVVDAAQQVGTSVRPVLVTLAVAASVAVLRPLAGSPAAVVAGLGAFHAGDLRRLGLLVILFGAAIAVALVPLAWPS